MKKILVTGANGQLGRCLRDAASHFPDLSIVYTSQTDLDISNALEIKTVLAETAFDYCINTAAYTNVEKAESERDAAYAVNAEAVKTLSEECKKNNVVLVHVSTDYVYDGTKNLPYREEDATNPINVYGASKLKGEEYIAQICNTYFIIRTSWLYSQYGHNFVHTIMKYAKEGKPLTITTEQTGTPTNANDLANALLKIVSGESKNYGIYHFSNSGEATWYDFAKAILTLSNQFEDTNLAKTDHYRTFAKRPSYSVLDNSKFCNTFNTETKDWKLSLKSLLNNHVIT